jgi:acetyl esterase/lipase
MGHLVMSRRSILTAAVVAITVGVGLPAALAATRSSTTQVPGKRYVDPIFDKITITRDIQYGQAPKADGTTLALLLDLYEPAGDRAAARPVFIFAHGSIVGSDKTSDFAVRVVTEMARRGYVAASINFRLLEPISGLPEQVPGPVRSAANPGLKQAMLDAQHDMQASVRWFRAHAASRRIDPGRITVSGHSAGAGIAQATNYNASDPGDSGNPGYPSDVSAAVAYAGSLLPGDPSPVQPGSPPVLMIHAVDSMLADGAVGMSSACGPARAAGNVCEFTLYSKGGHGLAGHASEMIAGAADFLCQYVVLCKP